MYRTFNTMGFFLSERIDTFSKLICCSFFGLVCWCLISIGQCSLCEGKWGTSIWDSSANCCTSRISSLLLGWTTWRIAICSHAKHIISKNHGLDTRRYVEFLTKKKYQTAPRRVEKILKLLQKGSLFGYHIGHFFHFHRQNLMKYLELKVQECQNQLAGLNTFLTSV